MKTRNEKPLICPNCFGTNAREVLATETSRNITDDDSAQAATSSTALSDRKRGEVVRIFCNDCGQELTRTGGRG